MSARIKVKLLGTSNIILKIKNLSARIRVKLLLLGGAAMLPERGKACPPGYISVVSQDWDLCRCDLEEARPVSQDWSKAAVGRRHCYV